MIPTLRDPEAACYALEAAACLCLSIGEGNWTQAGLDAIALFGWVKNSV